MASLPTPTHRTRLAQEKELPGSSPLPLPGNALSRDSTAPATHMPRTSPPRMWETQGVINKELSPMSTWGRRAHAGSKWSQRSPAAPPESTFTPSSFPQNLVRTGLLMKAACIAANVCTPLSGLQSSYPTIPRGLWVGWGGTDYQSLCRKLGLREGKPYARGNTASQQLFPHHPAHPWMSVSEPLPTPTDELSHPTQMTWAYSGHP